ncbi:hypothetical protein B7486_79170, partial [cyanobacterium TDX16]
MQRRTALDPPSFLPRIVSDEACVARLPIVRARLALLAGLVLVGVGVGLLGPLGSFGGPAAGAQEAQQDESSDAGYVQVIEVSGLLDPVLVQFVEEQIDAADRGGATALILQMNSTGAVVDDADVVALAEAIDEADTQVGVWIGPSGSSAKGAAAELVGVAPLAGMAP